MKKAMFTVAGFLFCFGAFSETKIVTIDEAVKMACDNSVSVARAEISLKASQRSHNVSPVSSVGMSANIPLDKLTGGDQKSKYKASYGVNASVTLPITSGVYTSYRTVQIDSEKASFNLNEAIRNTELLTRKNFYTLIFEKEYIKLQKENLTTAKAQYENNLAKFNSGRLSEVDALSAEVNYKSLIPVLEGAEIAYENDLSAFKQDLGMKTEDELELEGSLNDDIFMDEISLDGIPVFDARTRNIELQLKAAKNAVLVKTLSAYAPSINTNFSWSEGSWFSGYKKAATETKVPDATKRSALTVSVTLPLDAILPWADKVSAIKMAQDTVDDLEIQFEKSVKDFKREVESALRSIKHCQESIKHKQSNVKLAQKTYEMTLEAYNRGTKDLLALQNSSDTLLGAKTALNSGILTLAKEILDFESSIGVKFGELGSISSK